jgi:hypothetical protein
MPVRRTAIQSLLDGEQGQTLFLRLTSRKTSFPQRFYRRMREADEFVEEISAASAENTREFSAVGFQELLDRRILLQLLDRPPRKRKVRLLLYR